MDINDTSLPLSKRLCAARKLKGLTQQQVADQIGCRQSAYSQFESGANVHAIAKETIEKVASLLGVVMASENETSVPAPAVPAMAPVVDSCCPNPECPSNVPFIVNGDVVLWPHRQPTPGAKFCAYCGEVLEHACRRCGAPITQGAFCPVCGEPRVQPPPQTLPTPTEWAENRRRMIADWRSLL